jgi:hypothetical protein
MPRGWAALRTVKGIHMKFDPHELDQLVKSLTTRRSARMPAWMPHASRIMCAVEAVVMACLAAYFLLGIVGLLTS